MRLPILMYHVVDRMPRAVPRPRNYVTPERFEAQLTMLARLGYETIEFADWLAFRKGTAALPRRPVIVTFDDGYRSTSEIAWPLLRRFGFSATVFLVSDLIGKTNAWDELPPGLPLLDRQEIAAMQAAGARFESHTASHPALTTIPPQAALQEMERSRAALGQLLQRPVTVLCYPYGKENAAVRALAREAGYEAAVIARYRMNTAHTDPYRLTRIRMDERMSPRRLRGLLFRLRWLF